MILSQAPVPYVSLLPGFAYRTNHELIDLGAGQQWIVAALALEEAALRREDLASRLWPDVPAPRAMTRLRQTLWRLNQMTSGQLLKASHTWVALAEPVQVDYRTAMRSVASPAGPAFGAGDDSQLPPAWHALRHPLLPRWDLDWIRPFQETWHQRRVQALEKLAEMLLNRRQHALVLELADAAAEADPLRERPRRIAIQSCLHSGEYADAHRRFRHYRELLRAELGVSPSDAIPRMLKQTQRAENAAP